MTQAQDLWANTHEKLKNLNDLFKKGLVNMEILGLHIIYENFFLNDHVYVEKYTKNWKILGDS